MSESFFDLLQPGMVQELGDHTFTREAIIAFAEKYDPQRFHLSDEGATKSHFGALCASGWHTAAAWMRLNVERGRGELIRLTGYVGPEPVMGPSPGLRNLKWTHPVYAGDTITYRTTITGKRKNPRREGWGLLTSNTQGFNQDGTLVITMDGAVTLRTD
ncbi:MaoC family dehydratase [Pseudahrensia aquimaris]|uniref:MaoC family dehydratase n=1 Tax=Pseudahrensia aquimaris TaxID=744461 RepID=A0ABW3FHW1_9HYPH